MLKRFLLVFILALVALAQPTLARAAAADPNGADVTQFTGQFAGAYFEYTDPQTPCIGTFVIALLYSSATHNPPGPSISGGSDLHVEIYKADGCNKTMYIDAVGDTINPAVQISSNLDTASVSAVVPVTNFATDTQFTVSVNLNWKGAGDLSHLMDHFVYFSPGFTVSGHQLIEGRLAVATGAVSDGVTNFTPTPSAQNFSNIADAKQGLVEITHP